MRAEMDCMDKETPPSGRCINCKSWEASEMEWAKEVAGGV